MKYVKDDDDDDDANEMKCSLRTYILSNLHPELGMFLKIIFVQVPFFHTNRKLILSIDFMRLYFFIDR